MKRFDVDELNRRHGTAFRLGGRYGGGEVGAWLLLDPAGRRFVLKESRLPAAADVTARLRSLGYPAPRYVVVGDGYSVQEELPGEPLAPWEPLAAPVLARLLELNDLQAGQAPPGPRRWPEPLVESVLHGGEGYMVLDTLRRHSHAARELLRRCQAAVVAHAPEAATRDDVVHWDFSPDNVLCSGDRVTGVIDWDGALAGDQLFDLATLLFYAPTTPGLRLLLLERAGERLLAA